MTKRRQPKTAGDALASQLPIWRKRRDGLSAQQLADRIAELGGKLGRVAISEIENGRRRVTLDEALLLAAALNVPPPILFFPFDSGEHVAITPESVIHPDFAARWLAGVEWLASTDRRAIGVGEWSDARWTEAANPLRLYERHRKLFDQAAKADGRVRAAHFAKDPEAETSARYQLRDRLQELVDHRNKMRAKAMTPPWLEPTWAAVLKDLGEEG